MKAFYSLLILVLCAGPIARADCTGVLQKVLYSKLLGRGSNAFVAEVVATDGGKYAAKFFLKQGTMIGSGSFRQIQAGIRAQERLALEGLAPQFHGSTNDAAAIQRLVAQLPDAQRAEIQKFGGVTFVTLSEVVHDGMALKASDKISTQQFQKMRGLVKANQDSLREQVLRAEQILREEHIQPTDDQAMLQETPQGLKLKIIDTDDFEAKAPGDAISDLEDIRDDLSRLGLDIE